MRCAPTRRKLEAELRLAQFRLQRYAALEAESERLRGIARKHRRRHRSLRRSARSWTWTWTPSASVCWSIRAHTTASYVGQAVVDSGGVFGQVARVGQLTSEVILMSDAAHAIPVQINRNGLRTIAVGTGDTNRLKLPYLPDQRRCGCRRSHC
jgi:rod shape-determining protein MreC